MQEKYPTLCCTACKHRDGKGLLATGLNKEIRSNTGEKAYDVAIRWDRLRLQNSYAKPFYLPYMYRAF